MTEVLNADGTLMQLTTDEDWFGFEQEYFLYDVETNLLAFQRPNSTRSVFVL